MSVELGHDEKTIFYRTFTLYRKLPELFVSVYYRCWRFHLYAPLFGYVILAFLGQNGTC